MAEKIIMLAQQRHATPAIPAHAEDPSGLLGDQLGRPLRDLRISAIFNSDYQYLPHKALLSFEEITRLAKLFVAHGVEKIRLTGGEPLLRKDIEKLIAMLAQLKTVSGQPLDLTLTTN
eukprot:gene25180-25307_t